MISTSFLPLTVAAQKAACVRLSAVLEQFGSSLKLYSVFPWQKIQIMWGMLSVGSLSVPMREIPNTAARNLFEDWIYFSLFVLVGVLVFYQADRSQAKLIGSKNVNSTPLKGSSRCVLVVVCVYFRDTLWLICWNLLWKRLHSELLFVCLVLEPLFKTVWDKLLTERRILRTSQIMKFTFCLLRWSCWCRLVRKNNLKVFVLICYHDLLLKFHS